LSDGLGLIHATTLRWALYSEGRLQFNQPSAVHKQQQQTHHIAWAFNTINAIFLIMSYASASPVFIGEPSAAMEQRDPGLAVG
jgi:hypothetical protein